MRNWRMRTMAALVGFLAAWPLGLSAQCDTLLWQDFEGATIPGTWSNLDLDTLTDASGRPAAWYLRQEAANPANQVAASSSWLAPAGTADNWLVLPMQVICDTAIFLEWKSAPYEGPVYMDGYQVWLSTTGPDPDSFDVMLAEIAEGIGATAQPGPGWVHSQYQGNRGLLETWRVPLGPWLNDTIWIAFRHTSTDDNLIQLDDILISTLPDYDAVAVDVDHDLNYSRIPLQQLSPMTVTWKVENAGAATLPLMTIAVEAELGGNPVFTAQDSVANLAAFSQDDGVVFNPFLPIAGGDYTFRLTVSTDSADANAANDVFERMFHVTDSVMARDNGTISGTTDIGPSSGLVGQTFTLAVQDTLTSVSVYLVNPPVGEDISVSLYAMGGAQPGARIAGGLPLTISSGADGWRTLRLSSDRPLLAGTYLVGLEWAAGQQLELAHGADRYDAGAGWRRIGTTWASDLALGNELVYLVRPNFGRVTNIVGQAEASTGIQAEVLQGRGGVTLRLGAPLRQAGSLQVYDLAGHLLEQQEFPAGRAEMVVSTLHLPAGTYVLRLQSGEGTFVTRFLKF